MNFPIEIFSKRTQRLITETQRTHNLEYNALPAIDGMSEVSAAAAMGICAQGLKKKRVHANLYFCPGANVGVGKSESKSTIGAAFTAYEKRKVDEWMELCDGYKTELKALKQQYLVTEGDESLSEQERKDALKKNEKDQREMEIKMRMPELTCENITQESLQERLHHNGGATYLVSDEGTAVTSILIDGKYSDGKAADQELRKGYSHGRLKVSRKGKHSTVLPEICISANLSMTTDEMLEMIKSPKFRTGGMASRFLFILDKSIKLEADDDDAGISSETMKNWEAHITDLLDTYRYIKPTDTRWVVTYDDDAFALLKEHHNKLVRLENTKWSDIKNFVTRWQEDMWRISLVLHLDKHGGSAHNNPIDKKTAEGAIKAITFFQEQAINLLVVPRESTKSDDWKKVEDISKDAKYSPGFTCRTVARAGKNCIGATETEIEAKLQAFVDKGFLKTLSIKHPKNHQTHTWYVPFSASALKTFCKKMNVANPYAVPADQDGKAKEAK
jgi:hypothetical protein